MTEKRITDDLDKLLRVLPTTIVEALQQRAENHNLIEIVMDLGRVPTARYVTGEVVLLQTEISRKELEMISRRLHFDADNRAGMERTLHRISAIRNRRGAVVGLTCRIGRAVFGTIDIIEDLIKSGQNLLMLGAPGVGKTTMLRETARVLAESKRVVIVDTSNEIAGDGDVAHPAIGRARRMQVSHPERQHEVMIEAVENHNPEVIIIDEIGRELEAQAARTIAERGVQLIGTAHGNTLENLMLNPTLSDLVGGIESVTLSDEEARRRGTQKVVLERRAPPTFDIMVEIQTRDRLAVHEDVATDVDGILRGRPQSVEVRVRDENGNIHREMQRPMIESRIFHDTTGANPQDKPAPRGNNRVFGPTVQPPIRVKGNGNGQFVQPVPVDEDDDDEELNVPMADMPPGSRANLKPITVYAYGVARNRLVQSARRLNVPLNVTDELNQAGAVVTLKSYYRNRPKMVVDAERRGMPIYVLRANTVSQIENFLVDVFKLEQREHDPFGAAMVEVEQAITRIRAGEEIVDLAPQASHVRRQQHIAARKAGITAISSGESDERYVRLVRDHIA